MLVVSSVSGAPFSLSTAGSLGYADDFEDDALGSTPSGWSGGEVVSDSYAESRSLNVSSTQNHTVEISPGQNFTLEFRAKQTRTSSGSATSDFGWGDPCCEFVGIGMYGEFNRFDLVWYDYDSGVDKSQSVSDADIVEDVFYDFNVTKKGKTLSLKAQRVDTGEWYNTSFSVDPSVMDQNISLRLLPGTSQAWVVDSVSTSVPASGQSISGTVTNGTSGLSGIDITVRQSGSVVDTAQTNASGDWSVTGLSDGTYNVTAGDPWYVNETQQVSVSGSDVSNVDFNLSRVYRVSGTVTNSTSSPIESVTVDLTNSLTGSIVKSTTTDATGQFSLKATSGSYNLVASKNGFQGETKLLGTLDSNVTTDFSLKPSEPPYVKSASPRSAYRRDRNVTLSATLADVNGDPIDARLWWYNGSTFVEVASATGVSSGYQLTATVNSLPGENRWYVTLTDGQRSRISSTFSYETPGQVTVIKRDDFGEVQAANATIVSSSSTYRSERQVDNGLLDLEGVPDESLLVRIQKSGYSDQTIPIDDPASNYYTLLAPKPNSSTPGADETVEQSFTLDSSDPDFQPGNSRLVVRRYYRGSYRSVGGGYFGGRNRVTVALQDGASYKLVIRNDAGDTITYNVIYDPANFANPEPLVVSNQGDDGDGVANEPPVARIRYDPAKVTTNTTVHFDATESTDPDGDVTSYFWDFDDDGTIDATGPRVTNRYTSGGKYTVNLTIGDDGDGTDSVERTIYVASTNRPPVPKIELSPEAPVVGDNVTFDGANSTDPNGNIQSYSWAVNGTSASGTTTTESFSSAGNYTVELEVCDPAYCRATERTFYVGSNSTDANQPPIPRIDFSPSSPNATEEIQFNASTSSDPDGAIAHWRWDFNNDGDFEVDRETASWVFPTAGNYSVRLVTEDGRGTENSTTVNVTVGGGEPTQPANAPPIPRVNVTPSNPSPGEQIRLNASNSTDPDGNVTAYRWDFDNDGETDARGVATKTTFEADGQYQVALTVEDDLNQTNTSTVVITVGDGTGGGSGLYTWDAYLKDPTSGDDSKKIRFTWAARPGVDVSNFGVRIYEFQNRSNEIANQTYGTTGAVTLTEQIAGAQLNKSWVVVWEATVDGEARTGRLRVGGPPTSVGLPLAPSWLGAVSLVFLTIVPTLYANRMATVGAVVLVAIAGGLMLLQWVTIPVISWWAAALIAVSGHIRARQTGVS